MRPSHRWLLAVVLLSPLGACGLRPSPVPHIVAIDVVANMTTATTTATTTAPPRLVIQRRPVARERPATDTPVMASDDVWHRLALCESGANPRSVSGGGAFYGAFQFMLRTWHAIGMAGNPIDYSYADQLAAAKRLYARSGPRQWPVCSRRVGLV